MKLKISYFLLLFTFCANAQKITDEMIAKQKQLCPSKYLIENIEDAIHELDTVSLTEIKTLFATNTKDLENNKSSIIKQYNINTKDEKNHFNSLTKHYTTEEEEITPIKNTYKEIINSNHLKFRDSVQNGLLFKQTFRDGKNYAKVIVRNNGAVVYDFKTEETISPFYHLNFDSEKQVTATTIYYHDSKDENTQIEMLSFPLNEIKVSQMKHIDSIDIHLEVTYLSKIDTISFRKNDLNIEKLGIKLLNVKDNYVAYEIPYDYYPYHKGVIIEEEFYNEKGELLDLEYGLGNTSDNTSAIEKYNMLLTYLTELNNLIQKANTRKEAYNAYLYLELKRTNEYLRTRTVNHRALKGNVASMKFYLEKKRDTITFNTTIRNVESVKAIYVNKFDDKTEFIDKNGNIISSIPNGIDFIYDLKSRNYSENYFYTIDDEYNKQYYFLNIENGNYQKLEYSNMEFLCQSILWARDANGAIKLVHTTKNQLLNDTDFINFQQFSYIEENIIMYTENNRFYIYNENNQSITSTTTFPVNNITLKKIEGY